MKSVRGHHHGHPAVWATLTIAAFPIVSGILEWQGIDPIRGFAGGAAASLFILLLEGVVRGRWWISEPAIAEVLEHPKFVWRLFAVTAIVVALFQSIVLVGFMVSRSFDGNVVRFILSRQCEAPTNGFLAHICKSAASDDRTDAATMAVREVAEKRFFANGFVTCAVRTQAVAFAPQRSVQGAIVRCDRWLLGTITRTPVSVESMERTVVAALSVLPDGTSRIDQWVEDPTSAAWKTVGGNVGEETLLRSDKTWERKREDMKNETLRRALERLHIR